MSYEVHPEVVRAVTRLVESIAEFNGALPERIVSAAIDLGELMKKHVYEPWKKETDRREIKAGEKL